MANAHIRDRRQSRHVQVQRVRLASEDLRSNYLAFATALEHLVARGMRSMDFGITDLHNTSLRRYKVHWGGEERPAYFSATDASMLPDTLEPGRLLTTMIQRAPVFVGRPSARLRTRSSPDAGG